MKKFLLITFILLITSSAFAVTAKYADENYIIDIEYNEIVVPGDAIFARMTITYPKNHKKNKNDTEKKAALQFLQDKKVIENVPFYSISKKRNSGSMELLCGLPVSPWLTEDTYSLKLLFDLDEIENVKEVNLPINFQMRTFDSEDIELNEKNTDIKNDYSPERMAQIEKLNDILFTSMANDVYSLKKFTSPTTSTRYTAHFGDRRKYIYTNGKSSTNLHYGNDYGIPEGSPVTACGEGRVVMAENRISTGWSVVIEHLPGLYSLYYHLSEMNVKEGDYIKQGELLGKSGSTGLATGPHLHWEVRLNGSAVRPEFFMNDFAFVE